MIKRERSHLDSNFLIINTFTKPEVTWKWNLSEFRNSKITLHARILPWSCIKQSQRTDRPCLFKNPHAQTGLISVYVIFAGWLAERRGILQLPAILHWPSRGRRFHQPERSPHRRICSHSEGTGQDVGGNSSFSWAKIQQISINKLVGRSSSELRLLLLVHHKGVLPSAWESCIQAELGDGAAGILSQERDF